MISFLYLSLSCNDVFVVSIFAVVSVFVFASGLAFERLGVLVDFFAGQGLSGVSLWVNIFHLSLCRSASCCILSVLVKV